MSDAPIEAVILAGGKGRRLRPFTKLIPKPLVTLDGFPVLEIVLRQLARSGFRRVVITLGHEAELIRANFSDGADLGLRISYAEEASPLGTAGPLGRLTGLAEDFLVMNGDLLTTLDFRSLLATHERNGPMLTIAAHERSIPVEFGVIVGSDERVTGFREKPTLHYMVSMGIYAFNAGVLRFIGKGERLDFPDLVLRLLGSGQDVRYLSFSGYWLDIGSGEDYQRAQEDFPGMRELFLGAEV